jgi:two-component system alkaline phosphatase synthesis response regulator PhoP
VVDLQTAIETKAVTKMRILVVDDEPDIREVAQLSLGMVGGHEVMTAASGAEGLAIAQAERPDAIVLDVMMPELDGPSTFARLRENETTRDIPVVFLTAKVQAADVHRLEQLGAAGVLAKPFDPMTLAAELGRVLGWSPSGSA